MNYEIYEEDRKVYEGLSDEEQEVFDEIAKKAFKVFEDVPTFCILPAKAHSGSWVYFPSASYGDDERQRIRIRRVEETNMSERTVNLFGEEFIVTELRSGPGEDGAERYILEPVDGSDETLRIGISGGDVPERIRSMLRQAFYGVGEGDAGESGEPDEPDADEQPEPDEPEVSDEERIEQVAHLFSVILWHRDGLARWKADDIRERFVDSCHTPEQAERRLLALLNEA